jgi:hypothetical protein
MRSRPASDYDKVPTSGRAIAQPGRTRPAQIMVPARLTAHTRLTVADEPLQDKQLPQTVEPGRWRHQTT